MGRKLTEEEQAHYDKYVAWMRLTHNGRRLREDMPPAAQAEYDSIGIKEGTNGLSGLDHDEVKRAYEEVTRRSSPGSGPSV